MVHQPGGNEVFGNCLAAVEAVHTLILLAVRLLFGFDAAEVDVSVGREDVVGGQIVFLPQHVVVGVVGGRHLQTARAESNLHVAVFNHGHHASHNGHDEVLAFEPLVLLFLGVDAHGHVAHDGLGARGGYNGVFAGLLNHHVFHVVELRVLVMVDDLLVRERRLAFGVPVDHAQAAIDETLTVEVAEDGDDGLRALFVHGEGGAIPVA